MRAQAALVVGFALLIPASGAAGPSLVIYDQNAGEAPAMVDGRLTLAGLGADASEAARADRAFRRVLDFYAAVFSRRGYDGAGAAVKVYVHSTHIEAKEGRAVWRPKEAVFWLASAGSDYGGRRFKSAAGALDVIGHEFAHAVIGATSRVSTATREGRALNEHLGDLFGAMVRAYYEPQAQWWLFGADLLDGEDAPAVRDLRDPERGLVPQWDDYRSIPAEFSAPNCAPRPANDFCGAHLMAGIANKAAAVIVSKLGWEAARPIFYRAAVNRLGEGSGFKDYRAQLLAECASELGAGQCAMVEDAFASVGVN